MTVVWQALNRHADDTPLKITLDRMGDKCGCRFHAFHGGDAIFHVARQFRYFCKRTFCVFLDDPNVRSRAVDDQRGFLNEPAIDSPHAHDDHQQKTDAERSQHESSKFEAYVLKGQIHGSCTSAFRPMCGRWSSGKRTSLSSAESPSVISVAIFV